MNAQTKDVISVGGVETLLVGRCAVDDTESCYVVNYFSVLGIVQVATTVIATVTVCVCMCVGVYVCVCVCV